jgi:hypothetical protein
VDQEMSPARRKVRRCDLFYPGRTHQQII